MTENFNGIQFAVSLVTSFLSGGIGMVWGMKIGLTKLEARFENLSVLVQEGKVKLEQQVGQNRCDQMRGECKKDIDDSIKEIKDRQDKTEKWITKEFKETARFMGRFNGHKREEPEE